MALRTQKAIVWRRDNHPWLLTAVFTAVLSLGAPCLAQTETFQRAFAFGADSYSMGVPNAPGNQYTKIVQNGSGFSYTSAHGFGYTNVAAIDGSPNNRGKINCEIYDQMIGVKGGRIIFRVNVPNGDYRFVVSGGDAGYDGHQTRILAKDGSLGDSAVLVSGVTLNKLNYFSVGFNGKLPPFCAAAIFVAQPVSPTLRVTSGYIEIHQITASTGGDLCLVELWRIDDNSNAAPVVNAGRDTTVMVGATLQLQGSVADDGRVNATPTLTWTMVSGAAPVSFSDSSSAIATVTFSAAGSYVLRLSAYDGELTSHDDISVTVNEPSAWTSTDIGAVGLSGSATYSSSGGSWSVKGSGADVWGTADGFQFLYRPMSGDFEIIARAESLVKTNSWAKAGVMIRGSLSANSPHAFMAVTSSNGLAFQRRLISGGISSTTTVSGGVPRWVRVKRTGTTLAGSVSSDGATWTTVGSATISLGQSVYAGCAVTSHDNTKLTTAVFTGVSVVTSGIAPVIEITEPSDGQRFTSGSGVAITANASDPDGSIAKVVFSIDGTVVQEDVSAPYGFVWSGGADGQHTIRAIAFDNQNLGSAPDSVVIRIGNRAPVASAGPDQTVQEGSTCTLNGSVSSDPDGDILTYSWRQFGGPEAALSNASVAQPQFTAPSVTDTLTLAFELTVSDGLTSDKDSVAIKVFPAPQINHAPVMAHIEDLTAGEAEEISFFASATDPDGDTVSISALQLPAGASFSNNRFMWVPGYDQAGLYKVRFIGTDGSLSDTIEVSITVTNTNRSPVLSAIGGQSVDEGGLLTITISATDPDGDSIRFTAQPVPVGATLTGSLFSWTPDYNHSGVYAITFAAHDSSASDSELVTITVANTTTVVADDPVLVKAYAFGADSYTTSVANEPSRQYTKVVQGGANFTYSTLQGHGYTSISQIDNTTNNRGKIGCEIYDQFIGAKSGSIIFRIDIPAGDYRFVASGGDAAYGGHYTRIVVSDGSGGDSIALVPGVTLDILKYYTVGFGAKQPPSCAQGIFIAQGESPVLSATLGYIEVHQIGGSAGGDLCLLEVWRVSEGQQINAAPVVSAGPDQTIAFGESAIMQGTVSDDDLPEGAVITTNWSQTGGPKPVAFADSLSPLTSVTFSAPGIYALRLTASDGALTSCDDVTITVSGSVAHPRLFIAAGKIDSIRSAVAVPQTHHGEAFAAMKARVDQNDWRIYDDNPDDGNWNYPRSWLAREAALMYQITGSQWYAEIAYDAVISMYTDVDPDGRRPDSGYGLARAATGVGMAIAYDWCYNGWLASQRALIHTKITEALDAWLDFRHANIDNWHKSSNWTAVCRGGELILMLASGEETARESRYQTIKSHLNMHMLNAYGNGGLSQEGISYSSYAGRFLIPAVLACRSVGDTTLDALFDAKPFWRLAMTSTAFTPTLLKVQTGVDGSGGDTRGWPSLLFVNVPSDSIGYYRYWYDQTTGIHASPDPSQKYDGVEGGTIWSLICYPKNVASVKPGGAFSVHKDTVQGGYFLRNRYQNAADIFVSIMSDVKHLDNSWDSPEATQINLIARGIKFFGGPFKTTTADVFSTLLVDNANHTSTKHTGTQLFWRGDSGGCYSMVGGGQKYAALGVDTVIRHTMVDFRNLPGEAVISTLDKVRDLSTHGYAWQVNVGDNASDFGIVVSSGTESGCPYFLLTAPNGAYVKGWVLSPSGASVVAGDPLQVRTSAANADLWVSMITGTGTAPAGVITGSGMGSVLHIGVMTIRYDQQANRIVAQSAVNQAPSVDAGSDVSGTTGSLIMLDGIATDDGLPVGSLLSSAWTLMSGPAAATFGDTSKLSTSVSFPVAGTYVLRLRVNDGELESYDDVTAVIGEPDTVEQILLNDNFASMNNWTDLSRLISWGGHGSGISGFQTGTVQGRNAVYLTSDAMANSGYSTESSLKTFTALDYIFPRTVSHRSEVLTVRFTARWDALSAESGRLMLVLMDEYPAGGVSGSNYNVLSANHYGTPAYHFRLRPSTSTSELSLLEYGGGDGGVYEIYNNQWWLPGFISNASGSSSATPGVGSPYPSSNWIGTTSNLGNTEWANYTYKIMPDRQEIYRNDTLYGTMELPETNTAPQYEYFEQFKALRIYFCGINQCYLANVTVSVMPVSGVADAKVNLTDGFRVVQGKVTRSTGEPVANANVGLSHAEVFATTDSDGYFYISAQAHDSPDTLVSVHPAFDTSYLAFSGSPDTTLGILITMLNALEPDCQKATWNTAANTRTIRYPSETSYKTEMYRWINSALKSYNKTDSLWAGYSTKEQEITVVTLNNGLIEIEVAPSLGMRILGARDLQGGSATDFFWRNNFSYENTWSWTGGVEPSFPFYEAGTSVGYQDAGYRIIENTDGSIVLAMTMRFDHRQNEKDMGFLGHYGDRPLSSMITLRPNTNMFEVTFRADNPNPTRRADRMWNNTFFPRDNVEIHFPAYWAMDHFTSSKWVANGEINTAYPTNFALNPAFPFSGGWYAGENINRLRITDPKKHPGMKVFYRPANEPFLEVWGSTNTLFEAPGDFVGAYEPLTMTHKYYVTRSIGKVAYANEHIALSIPTAASFEMVSTYPGKVTVRNLDGVAVVSNADIAPGIVVTGAFADGIAVELNGYEVFRDSLPIRIRNNEEDFHPVRRQAYLSWAFNAFDKADSTFTTENLKSSKGYECVYNMELEGLQSRAATLNGMAVAFLNPDSAPVHDPDRILAAARLHYNYGRFAKAAAFLEKIGPGSQAEAEADYIRGLILWERRFSREENVAVTFGNADVRANYHRALLSIQAGDNAGAVDLLIEYIAAYPASYRPKLVLAYLSGNLSLAAKCAMENPGSPEALAVLKELGYADIESQLQQLTSSSTGVAEACLKFVDEIRYGLWQHTRRYEHVPEALQEVYPIE